MFFSNWIIARFAARFAPKKKKKKNQHCHKMEGLEKFIARWETDADTGNLGFAITKR